MIEVTLQTIGINAQAPSEEELANGADPEITLTVIGGTMLPIAQGPGQPMVVPSIAVKFALTPDVAEQVGEKLADAGKKMPKTSGIAVASSLSGIDKIADFDKKLRGPSA